VIGERLATIGKLISYAGPHAVLPEWKLRSQTRRFAQCLPIFRGAFLVAAYFAVGSTLFAQLPLIYSRSTYNAASYMPSGLPSGAIAQGSIFTVFGANMGPSNAATANSFPLGTTLAGVSINVVQGSTTVSAIPVYVSAAQINAIMPSNAPLGAAALQVSFNNAHSNMSPVRITNNAFGIVTALGTGMGPGILQNFVSATNQPTNSPTISAQPGQAITLWGTGLGPVSGGDNVPPPTGNLPVQTEVFVGGISAKVLYSGRAPCCSGTDQIVFTVPTNAPQGCWVPVYVRTAGTTISNVVSMAIGPTSGSVCSNGVLPQISSLVVKGGKFGEAIVSRATTHEDVGVLAPIDVTSDYHFSAGYSANVVPFPFNPAVSYQPPGTCTVYTLQGDLLNGQPLPGSLPTATALDLGPPLVLAGPSGTRTLSYTFSGFRAGYLGGLVSNNILPSSLFLNPGSYSMTGFGGLDVGPFSVSFTVPQPLTWTNRDQLNALSRTQPLTVSWSGGDSGQMIAVIGVGEDLPTNSSAVFSCIAPPGATSLTVPPDMLSNLPATRPNPLQSKDVIYLVNLAGSSLQNLNAKGLDQGASAYFLINGKTVVLQ
jgi:uncharacterized protein (TIGR03437 family)